MSPKLTLFAALGLCCAVAPQARADILYTVFNPSANFTLFVYDSPTFITANTVVPLNQLAFANPMNSITSVEFLPSSSTYPGLSEIDVFQSAAAEQFRYYPSGTFTQTGVTPGDMNSTGTTHSMLSVAVPEPATLILLGMGLLSLIGLRRGIARPDLRSPR